MQYLRLDPSTAISRVLTIWAMLAKHLQRPTSLLDFPQEVRDMLFDYLPLNSEISLRLSCRSYYNCTPALTTLMDRVIDSPDLTFERICMNERDPCFRPSNRLVCSGCKRLHDEQAFPEKELLKKGENRNCVGRLGRFYFTSDDSVSFQNLLLFTEIVHLMNPGSTAWRTFPELDYLDYHPIPQRSLDRWANHPVRGIEIYYNWHFNLDYMPMHRPLDADSLASKLQLHPVHICAHLAAHDPRVVEAIIAYHETWVLGRPQEDWGIDRCVDCSECQTATRMKFDHEITSSWVTRVSRPRKLLLTIKIQRLFGFGTSAQDPAWLNQMTL